MFTITVVLPLRVSGKLVKRETVHKFDNRQEFDFTLWGMLQSDNYRVNDRDATNVVLTVDNGNM